MRTARENLDVVTADDAPGEDEGVKAPQLPPATVPSYRTDAPMSIVPSATAASDTEVEDRLRRLEEAIAQLQSPRIEAAATPVEVRLPQAQLASNAMIEVGRRVLGMGADSGAASAVPVQALPRAASGLRPRWLLFELLAELRVIVRMYVDPRYRLSWLGMVLPTVLLALMATSYWWVPFSSITLLPMKVIDLGLAYLLFKVVHHETRLYRQSSPDLPTSLRL